jgi:diguanylate cyclase (GGDEF)-like protein
MKKANILVIDDEENIRELLRELLEDENFSVSTASSGEEGIEIAKERAFDVVITDLKMPGMSGIEVIRKFKEKNSNTTVIVITGYPTIESAVEAMKEGAYDYILKPFNLDHIKLVVRKAMERQNLLREAIVDPLTEVYNLRFFHETLSREISRAERYSIPLSLLMIDVDDFKKYNDSFGHQAGNTLLKELAKIFIDSVRKSDMVFRYGGEEFCILLPHTGKGAVEVARRILYLVRKNLPVTVSIGISTFLEDAKSKEELIEKADIALYHAKKIGKNCVCLFSSGEVKCEK